MADVKWWIGENELIVECAVVVMMLYNEWAIVEDMVDVEFVELRIARLTSNSSSTEKGFVVSISS